MNKSTKIWLNYLLGAALSAVLLWSIYGQVKEHLHKMGDGNWWHSGPTELLILSLMLLPLNLGLEAWKWKMLANTAQPLTFPKAAGSYLAGIAFSLITPNRIGEYPGRILYLNRKNTLRLVSVSVLGAFAQLFAVLFFGIVGLMYYNIMFPGTKELAILIGTVITTLLVAIVYLRFEQWTPLLGRIKWLRKSLMYRHLLRRFTVREQLTILLLSMARFVVFTSQYLILLKWMDVNIPLPDAFYMASLFFWAMAVIPSVALAELGIRGQVSLYLFQHFSTNTIGILTATGILWIINLVLPAIIGSLLIMRMRVLR